MTLENKNYQDKQRGWIFIDSLLAVVITVTALFAVLTLYTQITKSTVVSKDYQHATLIAQQQLETLRQYDNTDKFPPDPVNVQIDDRFEYSGQRLTTSETLDPRIIPYQITVKWSDQKDGQKNKSISVVNYYYKN